MSMDAPEDHWAQTGVAINAPAKAIRKQLTAVRMDALQKAQGDPGSPGSPCWCSRLAGQLLLTGHRGHAFTDRLDRGAAGIGNHAEQLALGLELHHGLLE